VACAHGVTNEQRLDGVTAARPEEGAGEASELRCRDTSPEVSIARDRTQKKSERTARYTWAIAEAKGTSARFDEAFKKDPDLVYGPNADAWKRKQAACVELALALEKEKASIERELEEAAPAAAPVAAAKASPSSKASAADAAFEDDTDQIRTAYKKKAKVAKAKTKAKKKHLKLATR